jgi:hypothetical protein
MADRDGQVTAAVAPATWVWQAWLAAVVFVFPIPHTIALRNLLLLVGIAALLWTGRKSLPGADPWLKPVAWWLSGLTAWIAFHSISIAPEPTVALDQFRANWVVPLLLGAISTWAARQLPKEIAARSVVMALAAHMVWLLGWQIAGWLATGARPFNVTPFGSYDYQGTLNSFLLALLLADRLVSTIDRYSPLALTPRLAWALLLLSLVSDLALRSRNSTIVSLALIVAASLVMLNVRSRNWRSAVAATGMMALLALGAYSLDSRWQNLRESAAVGWSSDSTYWMTLDPTTRPGTTSGAVLEESAYTRAAWARQSLNFIAEHPLGIGFGHDAFGRAVAMKYQHPGLGSSHNGWLDFALGTGLVGLGLLLSTAVVTMRAGWREFRGRNNGQALLLAFFVGGYTLRCLLDGHLSGWRLGLFAFIVGVLVAAMKNLRKDS